MKPRVLVLRGPGTNCDEESAHAFEQAGGVAQRLHINALKENPALCRDFQILCLPGGFSYGDDIAAGKILAVQLQAYLADAVHEFQESEKLVLGICNGFQVLMSTGLLFPQPVVTGAAAITRGDSQSSFPAETTPTPRENKEGDASLANSVTLTWNAHGRFEARWVKLVRGSSDCVFLRGIESLTLPIAHAEGRFVTKRREQLDQLAAQGQLALHYAPDGGSATDPASLHLGFPDNPNGSAGNVAGICDPTGRIFGLMPHPERYIDATQHPAWTRQSWSRLPANGTPAADALPPGEGLAIFANAVRYFA